MKRTVALAILGVAAVTTAFGQGHVNISNYVNPPYNQVVWAAGVPTVGGTAVVDTQVQLTFWYAAGTVADPNLLTEQGATFAVDPIIVYDPSAGFGGGGYFGLTTLGTATPGDYTVQIRASGNTAYGPVTGASALFGVTTISTALPADTDPFSPGLTVSIVPEPTTFALAGLGAAALLIFRRRD